MHVRRRSNAVVPAAISLTLSAACAPVFGISSASSAPAAAATVAPAAGATITRTTSVALDRITKRAPAPDGTMRRVGTGRGVTVYVFDGGVNREHPELRGRVRKGFDVAEHDEGTCGSHGTAVAGAVAGASLGVAPDVQVVDVKIFTCSPLRGTVKSIVDATDWVVADHRAHPGPAVVNWSFVVDTVRSIPGIDDAVRRLLDAGMLVVVAAGNQFVNACRLSPAGSPGTLVVGALTLAHDSVNGHWIDRHLAGSAFGPCIDLYAPGDGVPLPLAARDGFAMFSGTSFAAAYTSGAAAVLLERAPALRPDELRALLCQRTSPAQVDGLPYEPPFLRERVLYIGPLESDEPAIERTTPRLTACGTAPLTAQRRR